MTAETRPPCTVCGERSRFAQNESGEWVWYCTDCYECHEVAAESRIAAALALHHWDHDDSDRPNTRSWCICGDEWDAKADRCTSPTVAALLGGST